MIKEVLEAIVHMIVGLFWALIGAVLCLAVAVLFIAYLLIQRS